MHDGSPQIDPSDELQVIGSIGPSFDNIINDFVEYGDGSSDTTDEKWLSTKESVNRSWEELPSAMFRQMDIQ